MNRTEFEEMTHGLHRELLTEQFGGRAYSKEEMKYLTKTHKGKKAFIEVLNTLLELELISGDNLRLELGRPNMQSHGTCRTINHEGRYYHTITLTSRTIATLLHELTHAFMFDNGLYDSYKELGDKNAHNEDFDAAMKTLISLTLKGRE